MSEFVEVLLTKIAPPIVSLAGGWIGAALKLRARLHAIEKRVKTLEESDETEAIERAKFETHSEQRTRTNTTNIAQLKSGMRLEMNAFREAVTQRLGQMEGQLNDLEQEVHHVRDSSTDFAKDAELASFIGEQTRQWNNIQRTIGELIGEMKSLQLQLQRSLK